MPAFKSLLPLSFEKEDSLLRSSNLIRGFGQPYLPKEICQTLLIDCTLFTIVQSLQMECCVQSSEVLKTTEDCATVRNVDQERIVGLHGFRNHS